MQRRRQIIYNGKLSTQKPEVARILPAGAPIKALALNKRKMPP
jgi:hypothetical protein